ncbi:hypothetical protein P3S67_007851 [Capsicum chacoense]
MPCSAGILHGCLAQIAVYSSEGSLLVEGWLQLRTSSFIVEVLNLDDFGGVGHLILNIYLMMLCLYNFYWLG